MSFACKVLGLGFFFFFSEVASTEFMVSGGKKIYIRKAIVQLGSLCGRASKGWKVHRAHQDARIRTVVDEAELFFFFFCPF